MQHRLGTIPRIKIIDAKTKHRKTKKMSNTYPPKLNKKFGVNSSSLERSISDSYKPPTVLFIVQSRKKSRL
jgi:uncharacterized protein (UPF0218 family)